MTSAEFDALSDREVDALIAEKVMDEVVCENNGHFFIVHTTNEVEHYTSIPEYCDFRMDCLKMVSAMFRKLEHEQGLKGQGATVHVANFIIKVTCMHENITSEASKIFYASVISNRGYCKAALMAVGVINDVGAASGKEDVG
jgi:hypothetical protein